MRGGVAGWDPRRPCGSTTSGGLTSRDVGRPGPLRAPAVGDPATTGLSAPVARDATPGANRRARVQGEWPDGGTHSSTHHGWGFLPGSVVCRKRLRSRQDIVIIRKGDVVSGGGSAARPRRRSSPASPGVAEALFHASSGLARAALAHGATAGTAASSSGWSTTLSCSLGSVRAPITMTGSVWLRLTAMCEMPAGI